MTPTPKLRETPGGWLATSDAHDELKIGVMGATADEAAERFRESRLAWDELVRQARANPLPSVAADE
jgi:hypothetical protein